MTIGSVADETHLDVSSAYDDEDSVESLIPIELTTKILSYLPEIDLKNTSTVSKKWNIASKKLIHSYKNVHYEIVREVILRGGFHETASNISLSISGKIYRGWGVYFQERDNPAYLLEYLSVSECYAMMEVFVNTGAWRNLALPCRLFPLLFVHRERAKQVLQSSEELDVDLQELFWELFLYYFAVGKNAKVNTRYFGVHVTDGIYDLLAYLLKTGKVCCKGTSIEESPLAHASILMFSYKYLTGRIRFEGQGDEGCRMIHLLLDHGATPNPKRYYMSEETPFVILCAVKEPGIKELISRLVLMGAQLNPKFFNGTRKRTLANAVRARFPRINKFNAFARKLINLPDNEKRKEDSSPLETVFRYQLEEDIPYYYWLFRDFGAKVRERELNALIGRFGPEKSQALIDISKEQEHEFGEYLRFIANKYGLT